jgi:ABC-type transport system involved in multi-copper enzyme maturation permease subunit
MTASRLRLRGFEPFLRKELAEWWQCRAAQVTFVVVAALGTLGTLSTRIDQAAGGVPSTGQLDATTNIFASQFAHWVMLAAIFASIGTLTQERTTGTLAWTLSKPVSRSSVLLAKWAAALLALALFSVILPLAWMVVVATVAYGAVPDLAAVARFGGVLLAVPALFVAIDLAVATRLDSQAGIAAIAIGIGYAPYLLGTFLPKLAELWPSAVGGLATTVGMGQPASVATVASWALTIAVVAIGGLWLFNREDL